MRHPGHYSLESLKKKRHLDFFRFVRANQVDKTPQNKVSNTVSCAVQQGVLGPLHLRATPQVHDTT